jgi:hypothetical protein
MDSEWVIQHPAEGRKEEQTHHEKHEPDPGSILGSRRLHPVIFWHLDLPLPREHHSCPLFFSQTATMVLPIL